MAKQDFKVGELVECNMPIWINFPLIIIKPFEKDKHGYKWYLCLSNKNLVHVNEVWIQKYEQI